MVNEPSTFGLSAEQLVRLLKIGASVQKNDEADAEQRKVELLRDWLSAKLPYDEVLIESLPIILRRLCRNLGPLTARSFGDLLHDPGTDISLIRKIKDCSKKLVNAAQSDPECDAATVIYYTAIASALVFHSQKITEYSYKDLERSMSLLVDKKWVSPELSKLFMKAKELCQNKRE